MRNARRLALLIACGWAAPALAAVSIEHDAVGCVAAGKFPRFTARFAPADAVARARLHFRPEGWPHWYSVPMKQEADRFEGVLPKPEKKLQGMSYYISVTDREFGESRTPEASPVVVSGPGGCQQSKVMALALEKAVRVIVSGPEGILNAPLVPVGFSADAVIAGPTSGAGGAAGAAGASGAAVASGAAAGAVAAGGGISTAVLVVGGVAVAGGAAAIAVKSAGGGAPDEGGGTIEVTPQPLVRVPDGGSAQFTAVAKDRSGKPISPQPRFSWSSSCACVRVTENGLATLSSSFGPGNCAAVMARGEPGRGAGQSALGLQGSTNPCPPSQ